MNIFNKFNYFKSMIYLIFLLLNRNNKLKNNNIKI